MSLPHGAMGWSVNYPTLFFLLSFVLSAKITPSECHSIFNYNFLVSRVLYLYNNEDNNNILKWFTFPAIYDHRAAVFLYCRFSLFLKDPFYQIINEPVHEISYNVVCATSKASDQPALTRSLIRAFASRLSIL